MFEADADYDKCAQMSLLFYVGKGYGSLCLTCTLLSYRGTNKDCELAKYDRFETNEAVIF